MSRVITDRIVTDEYEFKKILGNLPVSLWLDLEVLIEFVRRGGYSYVVLGNRNSTKVDYAVKIFDKKKIKANDEVRLRREIDINFQISHPNIVRVIEVFESPDDVCLIMELMSGGELFDKIVKHGPVNETSAKRYAKSAFEALQYLHGMGIVHRDIKPENLLLESNDPNANIKLIDFGFAKFAHGKSVLTTPIGTPNYAAPEVTGSEEAYTMEVDTWSMGCVLYFMLFARPPFYSNDDEEVDRLVSIGKYTFSENIKVSAEVKDLIGKLLVMDARSRLSATEALQHPWFKQGTQSDEAANPDQPLNLNSDQVDKLRSSVNKPIDKRRRSQEGDRTAQAGAGLRLESASNSALWKKRQEKKNQQNKGQ